MGLIDNICPLQSNNTNTHLLNSDEYDRNDCSPKPELNDVKITPIKASTSDSAKATIKNPATCSKHAVKIRMLNIIKKYEHE